MERPWLTLFGNEEKYRIERGAQDVFLFSNAGKQQSGASMKKSENPFPVHSICLVVCYFGKLPRYLDCFLRSCACNPDINWLIITDDPADYSLSPNVRLEQCSFADLAEKFSSKLGFKVNLIHPHLLCDYRPAYGELFSEYLESFDFWGHCDLDMVMGDLRKYLTEDILENYNKVLIRGHLCLYRNCDEANAYYKLTAPNVPDYRSVFKAGVNMQFDEWRGIYKILRYHNIPQYHSEFIVDLKAPMRYEIGRFEGYQIKNYPFQLFYWHRGKIFQTYLHDEGAPLDVEFAYLHFQKRNLPRPAFDPAKVEGFLITPDGFFPYGREDLEEKDFVRYNHGRHKSLTEIAGHIRSRILAKLQKMGKYSRHGT